MPRQMKNSMHPVTPRFPQPPHLPLCHPPTLQPQRRRERRKRRRRKGKKTGKKWKKQKRPKRKKAKSSKDKGRRRATNPQQVVEGYKKVLGHFQKGKNLSETYNAVDIDRNTITTSGFIPELAISVPDKYADVLQGYSRS
ncbi:coiled-coil domain-containing protein 106-like%2C partial [Xyrichtys novacula]|uniref:Coiled-coil domain-containing protein 106-like, partial n=1 Tax=Xyrichtys novacula TaxID=13765 RepID=A0AAV1F3S4_XYRNO|nr:coiled-coil domain-containing protein 106-like%2C partial [Xyrichtys novacula]